MNIFQTNKTIHLQINTANEVTFNRKVNDKPNKWKKTPPKNKETTRTLRTNLDNHLLLDKIPRDINFLLLSVSI